MLAVIGGVLVDNLVPLGQREIDIRIQRMHIALDGQLRIRQRTGDVNDISVFDAAHQLRSNGIRILHGIRDRFELKLEIIFLFQGGVESCLFLVRSLCFNRTGTRAPCRYRHGRAFQVDFLPGRRCGARRLIMRGGNLLAGGTLRLTAGLCLAFQRRLRGI